MLEQKMKDMNTLLKNKMIIIEAIIFIINI